MPNIDIRPLRTEADYDWALREVSRYFESEPEPGTLEGDRFDILSDLIAAYEARRWPIEAPDPIQAIKDRMEQAGRSQAWLGTVLGSRSRASEVLNRRRPLSVAMVRKLVAELQIPADVLIRPYRLKPSGQKRA